MRYFFPKQKETSFILGPVLPPDDVSPFGKFAANDLFKENFGHDARFESRRSSAGATFFLTVTQLLPILKFMVKLVRDYSHKSSNHVISNKCQVYHFSLGYISELVCLCVNRI